MVLEGAGDGCGPNLYRSIGNCWATGQSIQPPVDASCESRAKVMMQSSVSMNESKSSVCLPSLLC